VIQEKVGEEIFSTLGAYTAIDVHESFGQKSIYSEIDIQYLIND